MELLWGTNIPEQVSARPVIRTSPIARALPLAAGTVGLRLAAHPATAIAAGPFDVGECCLRRLVQRLLLRYTTTRDGTSSSSPRSQTRTPCRRSSTSRSGLPVPPPAPPCPSWLLVRETRTSSRRPRIRTPSRAYSRRTSAAPCRELAVPAGTASRPSPTASLRSTRPPTPRAGAQSPSCAARADYLAHAGDATMLNTVSEGTVDMAYILTTERSAWLGGRVASGDLMRNAEAADMEMAVGTEIAWRKKGGGVSRQWVVIVQEERRSRAKSFVDGWEGRTVRLL